MKNKNDIGRVLLHGPEQATACSMDMKNGSENTVWVAFGMRQAMPCRLIEGRKKTCIQIKFGEAPWPS